VSVLPKYFSLWLFPKPLLFDDLISFQSGWQLWLLGGFGLFLFSLFLVFRFRKTPIVPFFIGIIWVSFIPYTSYIPILYVMDQIRMYFPLAGLSGLFVMGVLTFKKSVRFEKVISIFLFAVLSSYTSMTFLQNLRYRQPVNIFHDVVEKYPNSGAGWNNLAVAYERKSLHGEALKAYKMAVSAEPNNPDFLIKEKIWELFDIKDPPLRKKSLMELDVSEIIAPTLYFLILNEVELKEYDVAWMHGQVALKRFPAYAPVHVVLGKLWEKTGDLENARKAYANALVMTPNSLEAQEGQKRLGKPLSMPGGVQLH
jgi:tetratricopeptide (TPR) repeat protein